jgi:hypothetical protein
VASIVYGFSRDGVFRIGSTRADDLDELLVVLRMQSEDRDDDYCRGRRYVTRIAKPEYL